MERYEFNERQSYEALSAQVDALKTTSSTADSEVKALRAQIKSLKSEAGEKEVELMNERERAEGTLKEEMSAIKTAMAGLEKELEKKTKDLDAAANKYAKLESSYTESTTRESVAKESNGKLERDVAQLKTEAEQAELTFAAERRALEGQLRKQTSELEAERARSTAARAQLEDSRREANSEV